mgnify:CR=1 FL=1
MKFNLFQNAVFFFISYLSWPFIGIIIQRGITTQILKANVLGQIFVQLLNKYISFSKSFIFYSPPFVGLVYKCPGSDAC